MIGRLMLVLLVSPCLYLSIFVIKDQHQYHYPTTSVFGISGESPCRDFVSCKIDVSQ